MVALGAPVPVVTVTAELEHILTRARLAGEDGLNLDPGFAATILKELAAAQDGAQEKGQSLILVVGPALRRSLAAFLRSHLPDALVLSLNDLPETRRIEVTRSVGLPAALPPIAPVQRGD